MNEPDSNYDWFTFYLRTTYICVILTVWLMDQPKQAYKLFTRKLDGTSDNFTVNELFVRIHVFVCFATAVSFIINIRTNYITHIVVGFEIALFAVLVIVNAGIYYLSFWPKKKLMNAEIPTEITAEEDDKAVRILLWIITLVTIGKMIVSPSYIFYGNPKILDLNPELHLFLDNINNELFLYLLVMILFTQFFLKSNFFPIRSLAFNSTEDLVTSLKNTFKIYIINVLFLIFISSKTKLNFLTIVYLLCLISSAINGYLGYRIDQEAVVLPGEV